jgi:hypothetical protein
VVVCDDAPMLALATCWTYAKLFDTIVDSSGRVVSAFQAHVFLSLGKDGMCLVDSVFVAVPFVALHVARDSGNWRQYR